MRFRNFVLLSLLTAVLSGCNDTLDSVSVDLASVKDKVQHPLSARMVAKMREKGMDTNSPIVMRIFKEEGVLEIWKAKTDDRFDKITEYKICAWSGRLGPKVKEGDRQAPEGFYNLSPAHLNPNSKYYLAINTGYPNRFDAANRRNGSNLMIHGACSSSGCYSMTDEQVLEIYAFARDAFKGGQKSVQLQAFPFRMTAENMARHRYNPNFDFWKMLKVGYDNFEITKRPPEVNVCEKKYVFNQQTDGQFNPTGACPAMTTPPALQAALSTYNKSYEAAYAKALDKYDGMVWYDPSEAERKALVANLRKGRELAYAPTGSALEAGRLMKMSEYQQRISQQDAKTATAAISSQTSATSRAKMSTPVTAQSDAAATQTAKTDDKKTPEMTTVPVPMENPNAVTAENTTPQDTSSKKPFWKIW